MILCLNAPSKVRVGSGMGGWDKNLKRVVGISKDQRIKSTFVESLPPSGGEPVTSTQSYSLSGPRNTPVNSFDWHIFDHV